MGKGREQRAQQPGGPDRQDSQPPPHSREAEEAIIGAFLLDQSAVGKARATGLSGEQFYFAPLGRIYDACVDVIYGRGQQLDDIVLTDYLKECGTLDEVGGVVRIAELRAGVASAAMVEAHCAVVLKHATARDGLNDAAEMAHRLRSGEDPTPVIDELASRMASRARRADDEGWSHGAEILDQMDAQYDAMNERGVSWAGLDSGFEKLNDFTSGLCPNEYTIVAARPNIGKTTLTFGMGLNVAINGDPAAWFSMEMSKLQCMQRIACIRAKIDLRRFRAGRLTEGEIVRYRREREFIATLPIYFDSTPAMSVTEMSAKLNRLEDRLGTSVPLVVTDYIQLMDGPEENEVTRYTNISRGLQRLSKQHPSHLIAISQLSRAPEARDDRRPRMSDLRESGGLEQTAENVWLLYRPGWYEDLVDKLMKRDMSREEVMRWAELIVAKTKFGPTGKVDLDWNDDYGFFEPPGLKQESFDGYEF